MCSLALRTSRDSSLECLLWIVLCGLELVLGADLAKPQVKDDVGVYRASPYIELELGPVCMPQ